MYDASLAYSGGDFEEFGTGSMITRTLNDVNVIQQTVMLATQAMLPVPIICVMGTVLSFRVDAQMGAMMFAVVSVVMVALSRCAARPQSSRRCRASSTA